MAAGDQVCVLLPGVCGTRILADPTLVQQLLPTGDVYRQAVVWLDYGRSGSSTAYYLERGPLGGDVPGRIATIVTDPLRSVYGTLATYLQTHGLDVIPYGYDWRADLQEQGVRLAAWLRERSRYEYRRHGGTQSVGLYPLTVVAHSMGGLLMRHAWHSLGSDASSYVSRVVTLGCPHYGCWEIVGLFTGHGEFYARLGRLFSFGGFLGAGVTASGQDRLWRTASTLPSVWQMLPCPDDGPGRDDPVEAAQVARCYEPALYIQADDPHFRADLAAGARLAWQAIHGTAVSRSWRQVIGVGVQTPVTMRDAPEVPGRSSLIYSRQGDGIVAERYARIPGPIPTLLTPTGHGALVWDERVLSRLPTYLLSDTIADEDSISGEVVT